MEADTDRAFLDSGLVIALPRSGFGAGLGYYCSATDLFQRSITQARPPIAVAFMTFHPRKVHWFEAEIPRNQTVFAMERLASSGSIELEEKSYDEPPCFDVAHLRQQLTQLGELTTRYADDLPPPDPHPEKRLMEPEQLAASIVAAVREWIGRLLQTKRRLREVTLELERLALLDECIEAMGNDSDQLTGISRASNLLHKQVYFCPAGQIQPRGEHQHVFERLYQGGNHDFWLLVGAQEQEDLLDGAATLVDCSRLAIPAWLPDDPVQQRVAVGERIQSLNSEQAATRAKLERLQGSPEVSTALGHARLLRWYLNVLIDSSKKPAACRLSGWTTAASPGELERQLAAEGIDARFVFSPPRGDVEAPVHLDQSVWSRPFRLFVEMMGSPGEHEINPTPLVAIMVPFLFGFMFPDLGHGLVLAAAGLVLSRHRKNALILTHCGISSAGFGLVFGEVFGSHELIPSIVGFPLEHPVEILVATLLLGVGILALGLVFSGIEAWWKSSFREWLLEEAPVLVIYLSAALAVVLPRAVFVSLLALAWYVGGAVVLCKKGEQGCLLCRLGHLAESSFQLTLATLSFMRVGAFALAHSTFSMVVLELAELVDSGFAKMLVFLLGHLFIIVVEGLIVMVQTTRLVLFEFFTRFLRFEGRIYKPLEAPGSKDGDRQIP